MSNLGPNALEAFRDVFRLHEAREWRALVKRGDALVAVVGSSAASADLRAHAEVMCADAILHDTGAVDGLERFGLALAMWPAGVNPQARDRFGRKFVAHARHAGRYEPARHEAERLAENAGPAGRSAALRMLAAIAWDTGGSLDSIEALLDASYEIDGLQPDERRNAERRALFYLCQFHCMAGEGDRAWLFGRRLLDVLAGDPGRAPRPPSDRSRWVDRGAALRAAAWAAALAGDTTRGRELFGESDTGLEACSSPRRPAVDVARARVCRSLADPGAAARAAGEAVAGGEQHELIWPQAAGHRELGLLALDRRDTRAASTELEVALDLFRILHNPRDESVTSALLATVDP